MQSSFSPPCFYFVDSSIGRCKSMILLTKSRLRSWWNDDLFPAAMQVPAGGDHWSRRRVSYAWLSLMAVALCVLLPNLSYPLIEPDETRYAEIALGMRASRDWVNPMLDGQPYLDKPPMMYWLTAMSFHLLGVNEIAARLPSVFSALSTILITFGLGRHIVGSRAAWLGALSLALCGGFMLAGRFLILDSLLAFLTTLCFLTGYIAVRNQQHRWSWWIISGIACALGVLTKGPVALVLCAPPLLANGWLRGDQTRTRILEWTAFVIPMILICVPWYVAVMRFNPAFMDHFFLEHNLKRFTEGSNHQQPFWFYVPVIFGSMFPASLLLPSAIVFLFSSADRKRSLRTKDLGLLVCAAAWVLLFFSVASCKLPTYILPAIPFLALIIGVMLDKTVLRCPSAGGVTTHLKAFPKRASLILTLTGVVVIGADWAIGGMTLVTIPALLLLVIVAAVVLLLWNCREASSVKAWGATGSLAVLVLTIASAQLLPTIATTRSLYVKTKFAAGKYPERRIVFFGEKPHAIRLQIDRGRVTYFPQELRDEFVAFVATSADLIVIAADEDIDSTRAAIASTHALTDSHEHEHLYFANRICLHCQTTLELPCAQKDERPIAVSIARTIDEAIR